MTGFLVAGATPEQAEKMSRVVSAALAAVDPRRAVRRALSLVGDRLEVAGVSLDLASFRRIRLVGAGKASQAMARGLLDVLGERVSAGLLITKHVSDGEEALPGRVRVLAGGHPVPSEESVASTRALAEFLQSGQDGPAERGGSGKPGLSPTERGGSGEPDLDAAERGGPASGERSLDDDLLFCLISGGGSALMTLPAEGVTLSDMQELTRLLLRCGADIGEINTLRKHLDRVKGGGLARMAAPARVITLILSDVIGSPLDVIASGPTVADPTTYAGAINILRRYEIEDLAPAAVRHVLQRGARGELPETVKPGDAAVARVTNQVVSSNPLAAEAALAEARALGFNTLLLTTSLQGEASDEGAKLALLLSEVATAPGAVIEDLITAEDQPPRLRNEVPPEQKDGLPSPLLRPACIVAGGETTVTLHGNGRGGRNQEMALAAVIPLSGVRSVAMVTFATDGEDGPTDAAGAIVTGKTLSRARAMRLDPLEYLKNNDSYAFFSRLGNLLITGPTGTNVNDLTFLFAF